VPAGQRGSRSTHPDPIRGATCEYPHRTASGARPRVGNCGSRKACRWLDACSPGEGRAARWVAQSLDGRGKGAGRKPHMLYSATRVTHRTAPSRALHARLWAVNVRGPGHRTTLGLGVSVRGESRGLGSPEAGPMPPRGPPWRRTGNRVRSHLRHHAPQGPCWTRQARTHPRLTTRG